MRIGSLLVILAFAAVAQAKDPPAYEKGKLTDMQSVACGFAENSGKGLAGEILGTDSAHKKTQEVLCQEYVLQGKRILFRIRPKDAKHPVLLPIGEAAEFRIKGDKLLLRVPEGDNKEREYIVLSMSERSDAESADSVASKSVPR
jgi:hypothetical protein